MAGGFTYADGARGWQIAQRFSGGDRGEPTPRPLNGMSELASGVDEAGRSKDSMRLCGVVKPRGVGERPLSRPLDESPLDGVIRPLDKRYSPEGQRHFVALFMSSSVTPRGVMACNNCNITLLDRDRGKRGKWGERGRGGLLEAT